MGYKNGYKSSIYILLFYVTVISMVYGAYAADPVAGQYQQRVKDHQNYGETEQAVVVAQQYLEYTERKYGTAHEETVIALHTLGQSYFSDGRYNEAEQLSRKALRAAETVYGLKNKGLIRHLEALASIYDALLKFDEASKLRDRIGAIVR